jgi:hypothetical protein
MQTTLTREENNARWKRRTRKPNEGEIMIEKWFETHNFSYFRYGVDAQEMYLNDWKIPRVVMSAPDYIARNAKVTQAYKECFIEAKGFTYYANVKLKDVDGYKIWSKINMPFYLWFYDKIDKKYSIITFKDFYTMLTEKKNKGLVKIKKYKDGFENYYYVIHKEWLPNFKQIGEI